MSKHIAKILNDYNNAKEYSGGGMYGKTCVSISSDDSMGTLRELVGFINEDFDCERISKEERDDCLDHLFGCLIDSMGVGVVMYWPSVPYLNRM